MLEIGNKVLQFLYKRNQEYGFKSHISFIDMRFPELRAGCVLDRTNYSWNPDNLWELLMELQNSGYLTVDEQSNVQLTELGIDSVRKM